MNKTGLASVSFRVHSPEEIVKAVREAGLQGIEWGGDVHAPPGNLEQAAAVRELTIQNGLEVFSYGSYYTLGTNPAFLPEFHKTLLSARILGAPVIRIWAYNRSGRLVTPDCLQNMRREAREIVARANQYDIKISFECHPDTLTEDFDFAVEFYKSIEGIASHWQPDDRKSVEDNRQSAAAFAPYVTNVHVFNRKEAQRISLREGLPSWREYAKIIKAANPYHNYLLEFLPENDMARLKEEAEYLREIAN